MLYGPHADKALHVSTLDAHTFVSTLSHSLATVADVHCGYDQQVHAH